jgi:hypothetical protein
MRFLGTFETLGKHDKPCACSEYRFTFLDISAYRIHKTIFAHEFADRRALASGYNEPVNVRQLLGSLHGNTLSAGEADAPNMFGNRTLQRQYSDIHIRTLLSFPFWS